jgi:cell division protein FtsB
MKKPTPNQVWIALFSVWGLILTGTLAGLLGSFVGPGVLQAVRLQNLLQAKNTQLDKIQTHINELQTDAALIEKSPVTQQREIRRVLGYAAADEIVFEFSSNQSI